jgi:hypothetical protein
MTADTTLLERVRKLLAKAEADGATPAEAEAFTGKAAELMARYGIDRALLAATQPQTDRPANRIIDVPGPWSQVKGHLFGGIATAMRCQSSSCPPPAAAPACTSSATPPTDLERAELLYTLLLIQMAHGLAAAQVPAMTRGARAWRRSWLLGFTSAVVTRIRGRRPRDRDHSG